VILHYQPAKRGTHRQACRCRHLEVAQKLPCEVRIGNGIIQYDRPQFLQNLDGTTSGFFGSAQEVLVALPRLAVNGSNKFVLHLDDGIGGFRTRGMQEAQDNGNSLG
jgi:hypothetical protein